MRNFLFNLSLCFIDLIMAWLTQFDFFVLISAEFNNFAWKVFFI